MLTPRLSSSLQVTPKCPKEVFESCQFDVLFENEETAYRDIIPALGHQEDFPKYNFLQLREP